MASTDAARAGAPAEKTLKERINGHALLRVPAGERRGREHREEYNDLCVLLWEYKRRSAAAAHGAQHLHDPDALQKALYDRKGRTSYMDGKAFMEAFVTAVQEYEPDRSSFLTFFDRLYDRQLVREGNAELMQRRAYTVTRSTARLMARMMRLLRASGAGQPDPDRPLPAARAAALAGLMGGDATPQSVQALWRLYNDTAASLDGRDDGDETGDPFLETAADPDAGAAYLRLEFVDWCAGILSAFVELEQQEYPRLFMTNDILRPLKDPDRTTNVRQYEELLTRLEAPLFEHVFWPAYLAFVLAAPPAPDTVRRIAQARLLRSLNDRTIAAYKAVSPPAVSQQHRNYKKLLKRYEVVWRAL